MKYNFIEIGTSNFRTEIQASAEKKDSRVGISVEPLKYYLDQLPEIPNVQKVHAAITDVAETDTVDVYWIPHETIVEHKLQWFLRGCNSIGDYHPGHIKRRLTHLVEKVSCPLLTVEQLIQMHNVTKVDLVKIDTEGHDPYIMNGFYDLIVSNKLEVGKFIFESNVLTDPKLVDDVIDKFKNLQYRWHRSRIDSVISNPFYNK